MPNKIARAAVKNVKALQATFDKTEKPDFRLRRDLADAQAFLETVKVRDKAKRNEKAADKVLSQPVEAEKEADEALKVANKEKRAAKKSKKTAKESRQSTYISGIIPSISSSNQAVSRFSGAQDCSYSKD